MKQSNKDPRSNPSEEKMILLAKVQIDRSTQARVRKNPEWVESLGEILAQGKDFTDPVEVYDDGFVYWVGDGFHRLDAYARAGRLKIKARVREGTHRDAMIHAAGANSEHGLHRSQKDVRRAISLLLDDDDLARLSDRTLAQLAYCSDKTVAAVKRELGLDSATRTYTDKHGTVTEMNISEMQKRPRASFTEPVNTFHELPEEARAVLKETLRVISRLKKEQYSFVLAWLQSQLPPKPKDAEALLTTLELEEGAGQEMELGEDDKF
jgi:hypothetical protein